MASDASKRWQDRRRGGRDLRVVWGMPGELVRAGRRELGCCRYRAIASPFAKAGALDMPLIRKVRRNRPYRLPRWPIRRWRCRAAQRHRRRNDGRRRATCGEFPGCGGVARRPRSASNRTIRVSAEAIFTGLARINSIESSGRESYLYTLGRRDPAHRPLDALKLMPMAAVRAHARRACCETIPTRTTGIPRLRIGARVPVRTEATASLSRLDRIASPMVERVRCSARRRVGRDRLPRRACPRRRVALESVFRTNPSWASRSRSPSERIGAQHLPRHG